MAHDVTLIQVRTFCALAREGHFARAAACLHYSAPAVHQQIRALEQALDVRLFSRRRTPVELTPAGETLLPIAERLLAQVADFSQTARAIRHSATVAVGAGRATGVLGFQTLVGAFAALECDVHIDYRVATRQELADGLLDASLDIVACGSLPRLIDAVTAERHGLEFVPWEQLELGLYVAPSAATRHVEVLFVPEWVSAEQVAAMREHHRLAAMDDAARVVELPSTEAARSIALSGLGAAVLPARAVADEVRNGALETLDPHVVESQVYLAHRRIDLLSPPAARLLRFLLEHRPAQPATAEAAAIA